MNQSSGTSDKKAAVLGRDEVDSTVGRENLIGGISNAVIRYTQVDEYTTFSAEYAMKDKNLVMHFFLPLELRPPEGSRFLSEAVQQYWLHIFPATLDAVARDYFQAELPRLQAKYTEELHSWWFLAQGYDHLIDLNKFVLGFLEGLDRALEAQP